MVFNDLNYGGEVMAYGGFQIKEELLLYHTTLVLTPGDRVNSQMTSAECKKTAT